MIFNTEKQLREYGDKIPADKRSAIEEAVKKLKDAHKAEDLAAVDSALNELNRAWAAASEELYKASAQQTANATNGAGQTQSSAQSGDGNVTDAEYEEVK